MFKKLQFWSAKTSLTFLVCLEEFLIGVVQVELGLIRGAAHWEKISLALLLVSISRQEADVSLHVAEWVQHIIDQHVRDYAMALRVGT